MSTHPKPSFEVSTVDDSEEIAFTSSEKAALRNAWRVIDRCLMYHVHRLYVNFYTENESFLEYFRNMENKIEIKAILQHGKNLMSMFEHIIMFGLDAPTTFRVVLRDMYFEYGMKNFPRNVIMTLVSKLAEYMLVETENQTSPTLQSAINKLVIEIDKLYPEHVNLEHKRKYGTEYGRR